MGAVEIAIIANRAGVCKKIVPQFACPTNYAVHLAGMIFQTRSSVVDIRMTDSKIFFILYLTIRQPFYLAILLSNRLEICSSMLAQWADVVIRELVTFVNVSADLADKALFALGFWLWFYIFLVIGVGHGVEIIHYAGLSNAADKHAVCAKIHILFNLQGHKCVDIFVQEYQPVIGTVDLLTGKFIHAASCLETELLEDGERCIYGQTVYIENASPIGSKSAAPCLHSGQM